MVGNFSLYRKGTMRARALPLARALVRRGHGVCLVLPALDAPEAAGTRVEDEGVRVVHLAARGPAGVRLLLTALLLARDTLAGRPDVIHLFKPISFAGAVGASAQALCRLGFARARIVVDADDWEGTGGWATLEKRPPWQRFALDHQERWGLRNADAVTVASRHLETLAWSAGVAANRVHYVPNGAERPSPPLDQALRRSVRQRLGLGEAPVVLLYTRFFEFPLARVAGVLGRLVATMPQARLLVVGRGFWGEENDLARLLGEAGLAGAAVFAGWAEPGDLGGYFAAADVAIYPFADTLVNRTKCPAKLVELLAAGLPVVADAVGQTAEYVVHGESGLLVPPDDEPAFARAVTDLLSRPDLRARLGAGAAARIAAEFLWDRLASRVETAYGLRPTAAASWAQSPA